MFVVSCWIVAVWSASVGPVQSQTVQEGFTKFDNTKGCEPNQRDFTHWLHYGTSEDDTSYMSRPWRKDSLDDCIIRCRGDKFCRAITTCTTQATDCPTGANNCQLHRFGCPAHMNKSRTDHYYYYQKQPETFRHYDVTPLTACKEGGGQKVDWESLWGEPQCESACSRRQDCLGFYIEVNVNVRRSYGCCIRYNPETFPCRLYIKGICKPADQIWNYGHLYIKRRANLTGDRQLLAEMDLKQYQQRFTVEDHKICKDFEIDLSSTRDDLPAHVKDWSGDDSRPEPGRSKAFGKLIHKSHDTARNCAKSCVNMPNCYSFIFCVRPECESESFFNCFKFSIYCKSSLVTLYTYPKFNGLNFYTRLPDELEGYFLKPFLSVNVTLQKPTSTFPDYPWDQCRIQCSASYACSAFQFDPTGVDDEGICRLFKDENLNTIRGPGSFLYVKNDPDPVEREPLPGRTIEPLGHEDLRKPYLPPTLDGYILNEDYDCEVRHIVDKQMVSNVNQTAEFCAGLCDADSECRGFTLWTNLLTECWVYNSTCTRILYDGPDNYYGVTLFYRKSAKNLARGDNFTAEESVDYYDYDNPRKFVTRKVTQTIAKTKATKKTT